MQNVAGGAPVAGAPDARAAGRRGAARAVGWLTRPGVAAGLAVALLVGLHLLLHQDEGGWVAKVGWQGTSTVDGHLVEWEWIHVGETVAVVDGEPGAPRVISSQNLYRFGGGYLLALLREPLGGFYAGAVAAHVLAWIGAAWALYTLGTLAGGTARVGVLAAAFTATGPGFVGYLGQVDAHPFGYAAAAIYLALVERTGVFRAPAGDARRWLRAACAGLTLAVAAYTMEIGLPLLLFLWLFYGSEALWRRQGVAARIGQLAALTAAFLVPYLGFQVLAERLVFERVDVFNHPLARLGDAFAALRVQGPATWVVGRAEPVVTRWLSVYPPLVSALALVGAAAVPRRWLWWAVLYVSTICTAIALTKPATRELFLAFPPVYVLAAVGAERTGSWVVRVCLPGGRAAGREWPRRVVLLGLILAVVAVTNADLWGDYAIPLRWYQCQSVAC
jgi:hypothetical protein